MGFIFLELSNIFRVNHFAAAALLKPVFHSRTILDERNFSAHFCPLKTPLFQQPIRLDKTGGNSARLKLSANGKQA